MVQQPMRLHEQLHPQLQKDCYLLGHFELCSLLLLDDSNYPWFILVPMREQVTEIHQLADNDQQQLLKESMNFSRCLEEVFQPDKLNIAALGNVVPQLHIHHIARYKNDACWPAPVWGAVKAIPYDEDGLTDITSRIKDWFDNNKQIAVNWTADQDTKRN